MRKRRPPIHTRTVGSGLGLVAEVRYRVGPKEIAEETVRAGFLLSIHLQRLKSMLVQNKRRPGGYRGERAYRSQIAERDQLR